VHTHAHTNTHAHTCTDAHTHTGPHTHAQTHMHMRAHTHTYTHTRTHTHTHTLSSSQAARKASTRMLAVAAVTATTAKVAHSFERGWMLFFCKIKLFPRGVVSTCTYGSKFCVWGHGLQTGGMIHPYAPTYKVLQT